MAGWFELDKSSNEQYKFVLKAGNGEIILASELYTTKSSAEMALYQFRQTAHLMNATI